MAAPGVSAAARARRRLPAPGLAAPAGLAWRRHRRPPTLAAWLRALAALGHRGKPDIAARLSTHPARRRWLPCWRAASTARPPAAWAAPSTPWPRWSASALNKATKAKVQNPKPTPKVLARARTRRCGGWPMTHPELDLRLLLARISTLNRRHRQHRRCGIAIHGGGAYYWAHAPASARSVRIDNWLAASARTSPAGRPVRPARRRPARCWPLNCRPTTAASAWGKRGWRDTSADNQARASGVYPGQPTQRHRCTSA